MVLALCITLVIMNLFYSVNDMMPAICVMVIFYIFGMLDDMIGLSWQMKLMLQVLSIALVYFGGDYGVNSLYGLFGIEETPWWLALLLTLFTGLCFSMRLISSTASTGWRRRLELCAVWLWAIGMHATVSCPRR